MPAPIINANWRGSSGNVWTVPFGGGVGRVFPLGNQPVNVAAQFWENGLHDIAVLRLDHGTFGYADVAGG